MQSVNLLTNDDDDDDDDELKWDFSWFTYCKTCLSIFDFMATSSDNQFSSPVMEKSVPIRFKEKKNVTHKEVGIIKWTDKIDVILSYWSYYHLYHTNVLRYKYWCFFLCFKVY